MDGFSSLKEEEQNRLVEEWAAKISDSVRRHILSPEDLAMLQALYSRSPKSVVQHLEKVRQAGSGKFMDTYYVGYGHASIGDCGTTSIFVENVSMLAAKAIQDWPLYSGQEASTRYMDFSVAKFNNPADSKFGRDIQERWFAFYASAFPRVQEYVARNYPKGDSEDEKVYSRTVAARTFDILRAFLPAGTHTSLSWTTNLRQASDKLKWLCNHPDPEISVLGVKIEEALYERYGHSFKTDSADKGHYRRASMNEGYFLREDPGHPRFSCEEAIDDESFFQAFEMLRVRPRGVELPPWTAEIGTIRSSFLLDFGSYRDLQRHRAGTIRMPMLTTRHGFHPWYLEQLPPEVRVEAEELIARQVTDILRLSIPDVQRQNYVAMGFRVRCKVTQPFNAFVYRVEIRSGKTVHPTLREISHLEARWFQERFPGVALHADLDPDSWTTRRGTQTIEER